MTDSVTPGDGVHDIDPYLTAGAIRYGGGDWIVPDTETYYAAHEGLSGLPLAAFDASHSDSSMTVTIDTGEAFVAGSWLGTDDQHTVDLTAQTNGQTAYLGWRKGTANAVVVGLEGAFETDWPRVAIWEFDTDGSGVTDARDSRPLGEQINVRNEGSAADADHAEQADDADTLDDIEGNQFIRRDADSEVTADTRWKAPNRPAVTFDTSAGSAEANGLYEVFEMAGQDPERMAYMGYLSDSDAAVFHNQQTGDEVSLIRNADNTQVVVDRGGSQASIRFIVTGSDIPVIRPQTDEFEGTDRDIQFRDGEWVLEGDPRNSHGELLDETDESGLNVATADNADAVGGLNKSTLMSKQTVTVPFARVKNDKTASVPLPAVSDDMRVLSLMAVDENLNVLDSLSARIRDQEGVTVGNAAATNEAIYRPYSNPIETLDSPSVYQLVLVNGTGDQRIVGAFAELVADQ